MNFDKQDLLWLGITTGAVTLSGILTRKVVERSWKQLTGNDPPKNPADKETAWREAILWAASTGVTIGLTRLVARRGATAMRRKLTDQRKIKSKPPLGKIEKT